MEDIKNRFLTTNLVLTTYVHNFTQIKLVLEQNFYFTKSFHCLSFSQQPCEQEGLFPHPGEQKITQGNTECKKQNQVLNTGFLAQGSLLQASLPSSCAQIYVWRSCPNSTPPCSQSVSRWFSPATTPSSTVEKLVGQMIQYINIITTTALLSSVFPSEGKIQQSIHIQKA